MDNENSAAVDEWEDITLDDVEDTPEDTPADQPEAQEMPETPENNGAPEGDKPLETPPETFTLGYPGGEKIVTREEIISLAQKGLDYDRVRAEMDNKQKNLESLEAEKRENELVLNEFLALAKDSGYKTLDELIDETRANILAGRENVDIAIARRRVALDRRERALTAREEATKASKQEESPHGFDEFVVKFPDVKADEIPVEVWNAVDGGKTLTQAYTEWKSTNELEALRAENERLTQQLEAEKKAAENRQRSTGSRQGMSPAVDDEIDRIWNED